MTPTRRRSRSSTSSWPRTATRRAPVEAYAYDAAQLVGRRRRERPGRAREFARARPVRGRDRHRQLRRAAPRGDPGIVYTVVEERRRNVSIRASRDRDAVGRVGAWSAWYDAGVGFSVGNRLIAALDAPSRDDADKLVEKLEGVPSWVKVGLELFCAEGPAIVRELHRARAERDARSQAARHPRDGRARDGEGRRRSARGC